MAESRQLPHMVFGGELKSLEGPVEFANLDEVDFVGLFPDYQSAYNAWKAVAQRTVDHAHRRYFIVHLHRILDPAAEKGAEGDA